MFQIGMFGWLLIAAFFQGILGVKWKASDYRITGLSGVNEGILFLSIYLQ
jgi:hypothetical protein